MSKTPKLILITGATAGIGRTTALHLARLGHHVIASGRRAGELAALAAEAAADAAVATAGGKLDTVELDVTSPASIEAAVREVDRISDARGPGGIDVLVNNAGFGVLGPTAEITDADLRRQYETNVFGLMNVTRAFLPRMMARRAGRIINVSSVGGRLTLPYFGAYNSTKYAVESLSDALRYELRAFGIDVALIEPGLIRTNFEATAVANMDRYAGGAYAAAFGKYAQMSKMADRFASNPIVIARAIARAVHARRPSARYVAPRSTSFALWMRAIAPTFMWDWAMRRVGHLTPKTLGTPRAPTAPVPPGDDAGTSRDLRAAAN